MQGTAGLSIGNVLQVGLSLVAVITLIFIVLYIMRRVVLPSGQLDAKMKIISSLPLGTKERLVLMDVDGSRMLLGITAHTITTLHIFTPASAEMTSP